MLFVAVALFVFIWPTLGRVPFSGSMENLNVATVMELRRGGPWLIPHLEGADRVNKPPLTAWITAMDVPASLMPRLSDADEAKRDAAYAELALRIRIVALAETCITVLLVGGIAQAIGLDPAGMIVSAAAYATCVLTLRLGRSATTDVLLTMWIAAALLGVAVWLFRGRAWSGATLVGVTTGLAFMTKGPVCLLFIALAPVSVVLLRWGWRSRALLPTESAPHAATEVAGSSRSSDDLSIEESATSVAAREHSLDSAADLGDVLVRLPPRNNVAPLVLAIVLAMVIGLPWYLYVFAHQQHVMAGWAVEVSTIGASQDLKSKPLLYAFIVLMILPWLPWSAAGVWRAWRDLRSHRASAVLWLAIMATVPLFIMSFFPDRKDRYALPAMLPLAVLAGWAWQTAGDAARRLLLNVQFVIVAIVAVGAPLAAGTIAKTLAGTPWMTPTSAVIAGISMMIVLLAGWRLQRRGSLAFAAATVLVMLFTQALATEGYSHSREGGSEMKPLADAIRAAGFGDAETLNGRANNQNKRVPVDLAIYLNHPTLQVRDWESLPPGDHPRVAIVPQREHDPAPVPPPGWRALARTPRDSDWWWAFVQEPSGSPKSETRNPNE